MQAELLAGATMATFLCARASRPRNHAPKGAVDEEHPQAGLAAPGDPEKLGPAAGRVLLWHRTQPNPKIAPPSKGAVLPDRGDKGCGVEHPDARDRHQRSGRFTLAHPRGELRAQGVDAAVEVAPFGPDPR